MLSLRLRKVKDYVVGYMALNLQANYDVPKDYGKFNGLSWAPAPTLFARKITENLNRTHRMGRNFFEIIILPRDFGKFKGQHRMLSLRFWKITANLTGCRGRQPLHCRKVEDNIVGEDIILPRDYGWFEIIL